ncbi:MAG: FAD-dependent thymidylate synthase [Catenibacterium mitsuokai]|nr:FAD-dependent thymidylate synthase [Catenibacterium mitsuokai]MBN2932800.1 FAD-dependent thymidylate synthase [Catenibacterium mitsuokai]
MKVALINHTPLAIPVHAMGQCYGVNTTEQSLVRAVSSGHLSLLEHAYASFDIEMSQKCLAQITRHRQLSFTVKSTRGTDFSDGGYFDSQEHDWGDIPHHTVVADCINKIIEKQIQEYQLLIQDGIPYQIAAYVLPLATNVTMTVTGNLRAWLEYLPKRLCKRASPEHQAIARSIYIQLNEIYPNIINLSNMGMCEGCKETSCDFTSHKKQPKTPVRKELA